MTRRHALEQGRALRLAKAEAHAWACLLVSGGRGAGTHETAVTPQPSPGSPAAVVEGGLVPQLEVRLDPLPLWEGAALA